MATFDLTAKSTTGVSADSLAAVPSARNVMHLMEGVVDIDALVAAGTFTAVTDGDIFQVLEIPAHHLSIAAGAEVIKAFNGTSPTVDIDIAAGDDLFDGIDVSSTGFLASASDDSGNKLGFVDATSTSEAPNIAVFLTAADTIDVKVNAGSSDVTQGKLRVWLVLCDTTGIADNVSTVDRDQLD
tara:strand:- start:249 stop:800 length:552 start_codon:yes stop_codon:yes gene_type:complete